MLTPDERQRLMLGNALVTFMWLCIAAIAAAEIFTK